MRFALRRLLPLIGFLFMMGAAPAFACNINMFQNSSTPATCPSAKESFTITVNRSCGTGGSTGAANITSYRLFSSVTCRVQKVIESSLGQIWCVVQAQIRLPLAALITVYLSTIGAMIVIGMMQLSTRDAMMQFLKIMLIWFFATEGDYAIEMGYGFFSTVMSEGIVIVTSVGTGSGVAGVIERFDTVVSELLLTNTGEKVLSIGAGFAALQASTPIGGSIGLFLIMTVAYSLITLVRCVLFYLTSIAAIAFMWAFSPLFICTALFRTSSHIFQNWLAFMISFTFQPILLFAFLAFMEEHIVTSLDVFSCLVQERTAIVPGSPEYNSTFGWMPDQIYRLTSTSCNGGGTCVCPDSTGNGCACVGGGSAGQACTIITTEAGWNEATDFINSVGAQTLAALIIMVMTNAFLVQLPRLASQLTGAGVSLFQSMPIVNALDGIMSQVNSWAGFGPSQSQPGRYRSAFIKEDGTLDREAFGRSLRQVAVSETRNI